MKQIAKFLLKRQLSSFANRLNTGHLNFSVASKSIGGSSAFVLFQCLVITPHRQKPTVLSIHKTAGVHRRDQEEVEFVNFCPHHGAARLQSTYQGICLPFRVDSFSLFGRDVKGLTAKQNIT